MIALLAAEAIKLKRSLALLVTAAAPATLCFFAAAALAMRPAGTHWERFLDEGLAMWSFFMLPMSVTAVTMLLAQIEHAPRMWTHLLALPVARWRLFATKALAALMLVVAMQTLVYAGLYAVGLTAEALSPGLLVGDRQWGDMATGMAMMVVGALPMLVIQLWAALRWRSFVLPLVIGILGTFLALVVTAAGVRLYIPWLMQIWATMWPKPPGLIAVPLGLVGGAALLAAMLADLGRREFVAD